MNSLRQVLRENIGTGVAKDALGGDQSDDRQAATTGPLLDVEKLKQDLSAVSRNNTKYFAICVIMVLALFVVSIVIVLTNLTKPDIIKVVMATFGISCAGLITMMIKLWREKSNTEMLMILAINMDLDTLKTVVAVLVRRL